MFTRVRIHLFLLGFIFSGAVTTAFGQEEDNYIPDFGQDYIPAFSQGDVENNSSCSNGNCSNGSCSNGNCPNGVCSIGNCPNGNCPTKNCPNGVCPTVACSNGNCPNGNCPNGSCSSGNCPNGVCSLQNGQCTNGSCPAQVQQCSGGSCPNGNCPNNSCPNGNCPYNQQYSPSYTYVYGGWFYPYATARQANYTTVSNSDNKVSEACEPVKEASESQNAVSSEQTLPDVPAIEGTDSDVEDSESTQNSKISEFSSDTESSENENSSSAPVEQACSPCKIQAETMSYSEYLDYVRPLPESNEDKNEGKVEDKQEENKEEVEDAEFQYECRILRCLNNHRARFGLPALKWDRTVAVGARQHSCWLNSGYWGHAPGHVECIARISGTPEQVAQLWLNSPPHAAIILSPNARFCGIGSAGSGHTLRTK